MRHDTTITTTDDATNRISGSVLFCIVVTSGALFGMAAQTALDHFGLDLASVRDDLIIGRVAQSRSALAWWAWWFVALAAFLVGPLSVAMTRYLTANWWLLRGPRLVVSAAVVLGLAAVGHLTAARSSFDVGAGAAAGALVALLSAALAGLGARSVRAARRQPFLPGLEDGRIRAFDPVPPPHPRHGGGSVDSGMPARRFRPDHSLVPGFSRVGRLALAGVLAVFVLAVVSAFSGAAVVLELIAPGPMRELVAWTPPPFTIVLATAARPMDESSGPRPNAVMPMSASEYTFAKGYAQRHAAQQAAELVMAALRADIQMPAKLEGRNIAVMHVERAGSTHGRTARARGHDGAHRYAAASRPAAQKSLASGQRRYAGDYAYGGHYRHHAHDRSRGRDHYYGRYEHRWRYAGF